MAERWLPIPGYETCYEVSDRGCVRSLDRYVTYKDNRTPPRLKGRVLRTQPAIRGGYLLVGLTQANQHTTWKVHQLVLLAFVGPRPEGSITRHLNGDPTDNHLENLRYGSYLDNAEDDRRNGVQHGRGGETHCIRGHAFAGKNRRNLQAAAS